MKKNMGTVDRIVRLALGAVILAAGLSQGAWWGWIGLIPVATAVVGSCPAYLPFGLSTCRKKTAAG